MKSVCRKQTLQSNVITKMAPACGTCGLGHRDNYVISQPESQNLTNLQRSKCAAEKKCVYHIRAKGMRPSYSKQYGTSQTQHPLELIHGDICGPMKTQTPSGDKYVLTFINDSPRYSVTYLIKEKSWKKLKHLWQWSARDSKESQ